MRAAIWGMGCLWLLGGALLCCPLARAQDAGDPTALTAGAFVLRGRGVGVFPLGRNTAITPIGGYIQVSDAGSPELDLSYFITDHVAIEGEAGILHETLTARDTELGTAPVGKVWSSPIILVMQYHLLPHARWNPYLGAGIGILPAFSANPAGGLVQQLSVSSEVGATFQAGIDMHIAGRWYGNADVKKLVVDSYASVNGGTVTASGHINPWIVGLGIGYRF